MERDAVISDIPVQDEVKSASTLSCMSALRVGCPRLALPHPALNLVSARQYCDAA